MRNFLPPILLAIALSGCASVQYSPYTGTQQAWQPGVGAFVTDKNGVLPVYSGPPPHPFLVIGVVSASSPKMHTHELLRLAAQKARQHGAQALVMGNIHRNYAKGGAFSWRLSPALAPAGSPAESQVTLVAIRWR
jgi:hypothetical protein